MAARPPKRKMASVFVLTFVAYVSFHVSRKTLTNLSGKTSFNLFSASTATTHIYKRTCVCATSVRLRASFSLASFHLRLHLQMRMLTLPTPLSSYPPTYLQLRYKQAGAKDAQRMTPITPTTTTPSHHDCTLSMQLHTKPCTAPHS